MRNDQRSAMVSRMANWAGLLSTPAFAGSPLPFGGWPSRDCAISTRGPRLPTRSLHCLSAVGPLGTHLGHCGSPPGGRESPLPFGGWPSRDLRSGGQTPRGAGQSPLPFGGWPSRDFAHQVMDAVQVRDVSIAFRRLALSGRWSPSRTRTAAQAASPLPFGGWPSRDRQAVPDGTIPLERRLHCLSAVGPLGTTHQWRKPSFQPWSLHCLSAVGPLGTRALRSLEERANLESPLPFGGWPSRDVE